MTENLPPVDAGMRRLIVSEHRRRVERIQLLADHISEYAGYLKREVDDVAPDDFRTSLQPRGWAQNIQRDAAEVVRLCGEVRAIRDTAGLLIGGAS